jgi:hypothetical protein
MVRTINCRNWQRNWSGSKLPLSLRHWSSSTVRLDSAARRAASRGGEPPRPVYHFGAYRPMVSAQMTTK